MPYAREAANVIAALLRETETGNLQKLLADGLLYAQSLESQDLQRTNLQNAYLGVRNDGRVPDLRRADFYRADLSSASLKGATATKAQFYQARLHNTIFKNANLEGASFFETDLLGANFTGARLRGATFKGARNIPASIEPYLQNSESQFDGPDVVPEMPPVTVVPPKVFISKPSTLSATQETVAREVAQLLGQEQFDIATVERREYPGVGAVAEVRRVLAGCAGMVVVGFRQFEVTKGTWRAGTRDVKVLENVALPTTWNHVEAGMAAMAGLPILFVVESGVIGGLADLSAVEYSAVTLDVTNPDRQALEQAIRGWAHGVREANRRRRSE